MEASELASLRYNASLARRTAQAAGRPTAGEGPGDRREFGVRHDVIEQPQRQRLAAGTMRALQTSSSAATCRPRGKKNCRPVRYQAELVKYWPIVARSDAMR